MSFCGTSADLNIHVHHYVIHLKYFSIVQYCMEHSSNLDLQVYLNLEWQIFCDTENTEKSRILSTKKEIVENRVHVTQDKKYARKSLFFRIF